MFILARRRGFLLFITMQRYMETTIQKKVTGLLRTNKRKTFVFLTVFVVVGLSAVLTGRTLFGSEPKTVAAVGMSGKERMVTSADLVAVVGEEDATLGNTDVGSSWPGEIISSALSQIQPQRQGVIVEWRVNVGDTVFSGEVLGKISAPPATPELIQMLAEQTEAVARARAGTLVADAFAVTERGRLSALKVALGTTTVLSSDFSFTVLERLREKRAAKLASFRTFIERAIASHITRLSTANDFRSFREGSLNRRYGSLNQDVQNTFEPALVKLIGKLKESADVPIDGAEQYFALAIRLANSSGTDATVEDFRTLAGEDQKEFLEMLADYREAEAELADKETEYAIMISERGAMVERDRSLAYAEATAAEAAFATVSREIRGDVYITSPRAGTVSAIYKKVGDLVLPEMPIAVVAGYGDGQRIVRIKIPSNVQRPAKGDNVSVMRPGFPNDTHQATILGVGSTLDETGSYMADARIVDAVSWPAFASVRVIAPSASHISRIRTSAVWSDVNGVPTVWLVSPAGRIFSKHLTLGRTLGAFVEVYDGLAGGDRYLARPTPDIQEDMFLDDIVNTSDTNGGETDSSKESSGDDEMPGMEM